MKRFSIMTGLLFAIALTFAFNTQELQAQPPGDAVGSGTLNVVPNTDGPKASLDAVINVGWGQFEDVSPTIRRASITEGDLGNALFQTETELGPETWIELRADLAGGYWVWVCHRVRICTWYCGWCCVPTWQTVCWRSYVTIDNWDTGVDVEIGLLEDTEFVDSQGNTLTVAAEGSSLSFVIP